MAGTDSIDMLAANRRKSDSVRKYLVSLFRDRADQLFLIDGSTGGRLTYADFLERSVLFAGHLRALRVEEDDCIVTFLENSADTLVLYFAAMLSGVRCAPIDPLKGAGEIGDILEQLSYRCIVASRDLPGVSDKIVSLDDFQSAARSGAGVKDAADGLLRGVDFEKVFLISFTSGSTGKPKGVMHSALNLILSAMSFRDRLGFTGANRFYHNLPMSYMAGILNQFFLPLVSGSSLVVGDRFNLTAINRFWTVPRNYEVNTFWLVPTILSLLLKLDRGQEGVSYAALQKPICCVGTAPLSMRLRHDFESRYGIPLYESYGLSETLFNASESPRGARAGSVGRPLDGVRFELASDGEVLIACDWTFLGYVSAQDAPSHAGFFASGDLGSIDADGFLTITGRKKDLIIRGGINISPRRLEELVHDLRVCDEALIIGFPDELLGERAVCFYVPHEGDDRAATERAIHNAIRQQLGGAYGIDEFFKLSEMPRLTNAKPDKQRLRSIYETQANDRRG